MAKYVLKAVKGQAADAAYSDREAPFFIMSRRPGLGAEAYEKFKEEWSLTGEMGISTRKGSEVIPLPAFYGADSGGLPGEVRSPSCSSCGSGSGVGSV